MNPTPEDNIEAERIVAQMQIEPCCCTVSVVEERINLVAQSRAAQRERHEAEIDGLREAMVANCEKKFVWWEGAMIKCGTKFESGILFCKTCHTVSLFDAARERGGDEDGEV